MAKKIAILLLSMILVLSLAACKNNAEETVSDRTNENVLSDEIQSADLSDETKPIEESTTSKETTTENTTSATEKQTVTSAKAATTAKAATAAKRVTTTAKATATTTTTKRVTTTAKATTTTTKRVTTTAKATTTTKPNYTVNSSNSNIKSVYSSVNQQRVNNGLSKLSYRNDLQNAANTRAKEIAEKFSHTRPNGSSCFTVVKNAGVSYKTIGENIGQTTGTSSDVMNWWMDSPAHRGNILATQYTGIAIGYYEANGVKYYVQIFVG